MPSAAQASLRRQLIASGRPVAARTSRATIARVATTSGGTGSSRVPLWNGASPKFSTTMPSTPPSASARASRRAAAMMASTSGLPRADDGHGRRWTTPRRGRRGEADTRRIVSDGRARRPAGSGYGDAVAIPAGRALQSAPAMNALDFAVPAQEIANHFAIAGDDLIKLLCATVAGALIGGERGYRGRAAGFRTIIFICVGAAFFTIVSHKIAITYDRDPTRIAANVVSGVGFLGAGVILRDGVRVTGLTTAAIVWVSAALGVGFGAGQCGLAAAGTVITLVVLWVFPYLERPIDALRETRTYEVVC